MQEPSRTAQAIRVSIHQNLMARSTIPHGKRQLPSRISCKGSRSKGRSLRKRLKSTFFYDKHSVYFGVLCFDSDPAKIVARELRRDVTQELDDYFEIIIDSAHDRRNAYVFQFNPLGTQRDALITEEQRTESDRGDGDPGWDGVWTSESHITKQGWTATIAIPFSTLNFMQSQDVIWGINFKRFIRRKNEENLWSGWRRAFGAARISQAGGSPVWSPQTRRSVTKIGSPSSSHIPGVRTPGLLP